MTIKMPVCLSALAFCMFFTACKTAKKEETSETKLAISIPPQKIDADQLKQLIKMIKSEASAKSPRGISVSDTFRFFNLTDEEMGKIKASRKNATTVQKFNNRGTTYYLLKSVGNSVKTPVQSTGGYTVYFAPTVNLYVEVLADDKLDICRMEGIQIYTYVKWNDLVGFYGDGSENAGPSRVVAAPAFDYPKSNCIKN